MGNASKKMKKAVAADYVKVSEFAKMAGLSTQRIYQMLGKDLVNDCIDIEGRKFVNIHALQRFSKDSDEDLTNRNIDLPSDLPSDLHDLPSDSHNLPSDLPNDSHDLPSDLPSDSHDLPSDLPNDSHDLPSDLPSDSHDLPSDLPNDSHDLPSDLPSDLHNLPNNEELVKSLQERICDLQKQIKRLEAQLVVKDEQIKVKDTQISTLQAHTDDLTATLTSMQNNIQTLTDALSIAQKLHAGTIQGQLHERAERVDTTSEMVSSAAKEDTQPKHWWQKNRKKKHKL